MHYYLASWGGDGRSSDYRPLLDVEHWSVIDLRPDPTRRDGWCLVGCDQRPDRDRDAHYLGDDAGGRLPPLTHGRFANRLGVGLTQQRFRHAVAELLVEHAREDGTRWRPLRRGRDGWEIHLHGPLWRAPAGGAQFLEPFTGSDNTAIASATINLTWTDVVAGWGVQSNQGYISSSGAVAYARAGNDAATTDQFAQFTLITKTDAAADWSQSAPLVRFASAANTSYMACRGQDAANDFNIRKTVTGSRTGLTTGTQALALPEAIRCEAVGSTIRGLINSVVVPTLTDTSITTGTRGGIYGYRPTSSQSVVVDNWSFGDLAIPGRPQPYTSRRRAATW